MKVTLLNKAQNQRTGTIAKTFLLEQFPKFLLAELNKHRLFSSSAESSRARPTASVIKQVLEDPYIPDFTINQPGMSGKFSDLDTYTAAKSRWLNLAKNTVLAIQNFEDLNIHKQDINRLLEPWMKCSVLITATEYENFYNLRTAENVQPAMRKFAEKMRSIDYSTQAKKIEVGEIYKPWPELSIYQNVAKAASISYANHAKTRTEEDAKILHDKLASQKHFTPFEHILEATYTGAFFYRKEQRYCTFDHFDITPSSLARCLHPGTIYIDTANFKSFWSYRKYIELFGNF